MKRRCKMNITREINNVEFTTELTQSELYLAYEEYVCKAYVEDVKCFLSILGLIVEDFTYEQLSIMAKLFYSIKMECEYTDDYAMAKAILPFLKEIGISCIYRISDFEDTSYLKCI